MRVHANDGKVDRLFEAASKKGGALDGQDDALTQLNSARVANAVLAPRGPAAERRILCLSSTLGGAHT